MPREVDDRKKRAALRKLRKAAALAASGLGPPLSDWERQFLEEVEARIETYGSAFADPSKGEEGAALSGLQAVKLKEIDRKASGKSKGGFGQRKSGFKSKHAPPPAAEPETDLPEAATPVALAKPGLAIVPGTASPPNRRPKPRPALRVIEGGLKKSET